MSGIKRTAEDRRVSKEVRERDGWTCQRCGREYERGDGRLQAAHCFTRAIKRMGLRVDKDNLLSLCFGCHQFVDSHDGEKETLWRLRIGNDRYERIAAIAHQKRDRV